jgi:ribose 1,5-bisphosphokinase
VTGVAAPGPTLVADQEDQGRLVLVVGPSGAGKDSLIRAARAALGHDPRYVFPRRVITRAASEAEDSLEVGPAEFAALRAAGGLAIAWSAHGLEYGLPAAIEHCLAAGRTVVCNVSRTVVAALRSRYAGAVVVVEVTAPPDVLEARLAGRSREAGDAVAARLKRSDEVEAARADVSIDNAGALEGSVRAFLAALTGGPSRRP